jgi:hypothetical protein
MSNVKSKLSKVEDVMICGCGVGVVTPVGGGWMP